MKETQEERIARVLRDEIALTPYDPAWPMRFAEEAARLGWLLTDCGLLAIEHVGSTSVPGLLAKPIVDILATVRDLTPVRERIVPNGDEYGYDAFWRPVNDDDAPPYYGFLIRRDENGVRSHHIHIIEPGCRIAECLLFRDYLVARPELCAEYVALKRDLAARFPNDRIAYTHGKTAFVRRITDQARAERAAESLTP